SPCLSIRLSPGGPFMRRAPNFQANPFQLTQGPGASTQDVGLDAKIRERDFRSPIGLYCRPLRWIEHLDQLRSSPTHWSLWEWQTVMCPFGIRPVPLWGTGFYFLRIGEQFADPSLKVARRCDLISLCVERRAFGDPPVRRDPFAVNAQARAGGLDDEAVVL